MPFLEETKRLYIHENEATDEHVSEYLSKLVRWMNWIQVKLE